MANWDALSLKKKLTTFDFTDIRLILNMANTLSMTQGASLTHISLSAASIRIKNLEKRLGAKLFTRSGHAIELTSAGQTVLHHGRVLLNQFEGLQQELQEYAQGSKGDLRICANTIFVTEFLPAILVSFLKAYPEIVIDLRERNSSAVARAVMEGATDIGFIASGNPTRNLEVFGYKRERLVLAAGISHPLARLDRVNFAETLEYDFVGLSEGAATRALFMKIVGSMNAHLKMRVEVSSPETLCFLIHSGVGVGILPESAARRHARNMAVKVIPLNDTWAGRDLQVCVRDRNRLSIPARKFLDLVLVEIGLNATTDSQREAE